jgi:hypothetical protein
MSAGDAGLGMNLRRRTQPCLSSKNEKRPRKGTLLFILVAGAGYDEIGELSSAKIELVA